MRFEPLNLDGAFKIDLDKFEDERGFFARQFCVDEFTDVGLNTTWVQMNTSFSREKGTVRGMHFQRAPAAEVKMIRCVKGKIFDVLVDLRAGSKTYGKWIGGELSDENRSTFYIPEGFAHGFQTCSENVELMYWHSMMYSPGVEGGLNPMDNDLKIEWPIEITEMSNRDKNLPMLSDLEPINL